MTLVQLLDDFHVHNMSHPLLRDICRLRACPARWAPQTISNRHTNECGRINYYV